MILPVAGSNMIKSFIRWQSGAFIMELRRMMEEILSQNIISVE